MQGEGDVVSAGWKDYRGRQEGKAAGEEGLESRKKGGDRKSVKGSMFQSNGRSLMKKNNNKYEVKIDNTNRGGTRIKGKKRGTERV